MKYNGKEVTEVEQPEPFFYQTGNVFIKQIHLKKVGYHTYGHAHEHDHVSLLACGRVLVQIIDADGIVLDEDERIAPCGIEIKAGTHHVFHALEPDTMMYCVHDTHGLVPDDLGKPFVPQEMR